MTADYEETKQPGHDLNVSTSYGKKTPETTLYRALSLSLCSSLTLLYQRQLTQTTTLRRRSCQATVKLSFPSPLSGDVSDAQDDAALSIETITLLRESHLSAWHDRSGA